MKIKLDENLPTRLTGVLTQFGHQIDTVPEEGLAGQDDTRVWEAVQRSGRFLITQDLDFSNIRLFAPGTHKGILLIRMRLPGRNALVNRIQTVFASENVEEWSGCFVVATEHKLRVRRPDKK